MPGPMRRWSRCRRSTCRRCPTWIPWTATRRCVAAEAEIGGVVGYQGRARSEVCIQVLTFYRVESEGYDISQANGRRVLRDCRRACATSLGPPKFGDRPCKSPFPWRVICAHWRMASWHVVKMSFVSVSAGRRLAARVDPAVGEAAPTAAGGRQRSRGAHRH